jgi:hypothetical protein
VDAAKLGPDSDFYQLGGDSLLMVKMIAGVCRELLDADGERHFMARLGDIVGEATVGKVAEVARDVQSQSHSKSQSAAGESPADQTSSPAPALA